MRKPLQEWQLYEGAGGPHSGIQVVNVHPKIAKACFDGDSINTDLYMALHTTIDLDGLYDILELKDTLSSWKAAEQRNAAWRRTI